MIKSLRRLGKRGTLTEYIGGELLDEVLEAGLAIVLVVFGVSYFNLENNWINAVKIISQKTGGIGAAEVSLMYNTIINSFPFNFIAAHITGTLITGIVLCIIGLTAKILTIKTKEEFVKDLGKVILVPGIVGVIAIVIIQLLTVNSINELIAKASLASTQSAMAQIDPGIMIWSMMSMLFLVGLTCIVFGSMLVFVIKSLDGRPIPLYIAGKFIAFVGWFSIIYYAIVRVLAMDFLANALYGQNIMKLFAFAWYMGRGTFLVSVAMFGLGFTLYRYGDRAAKRKRRMMIKKARMGHLPRPEHPGSAHTPYHPYQRH